MTDVAPVDDRARVEDALEDGYGIPPGAVAHLRFLETPGGRVYAATTDPQLDPQAAPVPIERVGLYFASWEDGRLRLSMDGAALVASHADPGCVLELTDTEAHRWLEGRSLLAPAHVHRPLVILRHGRDVLGCAPHVDGKLRNRVRKTRRIPLPDRDGGEGGGEA